jgi:hypothetical protein
VHGSARLVRLQTAASDYAASFSRDTSSEPGDGGLRASTALAAKCVTTWPTTRGSLMNAIIRISSPQRGQTNGSDQLRRRTRRSGSVSASAVGEAPADELLLVAACCRARRARTTLEYAP